MVNIISTLKELKKTNQSLEQKNNKEKFCNKLYVE